jgi:hypothetical protein
MNDQAKTTALRQITELLRAREKGYEVNSLLLDERFQQLIEMGVTPEEIEQALVQDVPQVSETRQQGTSIWRRALGRIGLILLGAVLSVFLSLVAVYWFGDRLIPIPPPDNSTAESLILLQTQVADLASRLADLSTPTPSPPLPLLPVAINIDEITAPLRADGRSQITIRVNVHDIYGAPVLDGTELAFSVLPPNGGRIEPQKSRTVLGVAQATFVVGQTPGLVMITARAQDNGASTVTLLMLDPSPVIPTITASPAPSAGTPNASKPGAVSPTPTDVPQATPVEQTKKP